MTTHELLPNSYTLISDYLGVSITTAIILLSIIGIWSLVWKGFALWKSSRRNQLVWFIVLLVINTAGILEILYIFVFSELGRRPRARRPSSKNLARLGKK